MSDDTKFYVTILATCLTFIILGYMNLVAKLAQLEQCTNLVK